MAGNQRRREATERVMLKLKASIEVGDYYEAHQMYRTIYFRYLSQKRYDELVDLLYDGATLFLTHDQANSGADLGILLVDVLNKSGKEATDGQMDKLGNLFSLMAADSPERMTFLTAALQWSGKSSDQKFSVGHPKLHQCIALTLWKEKNYPQSRYHFIHSTDGYNCATMLIEYHIAKGYPSEVDLFIAQTVFQYLCLKNKSTASTAFQTYTQKHPGVSKGPPFLAPLLNFLQFLLLAIEREKLAYFKVLCEHYKPSLNRDPSYPEYMERIGQLFFGLAPPPKQQGSLGNLLQSLLGNFEEEESESSVPGSSKDYCTMQPEDLD